MIRAASKSLLLLTVILSMLVFAPTLAAKKKKVEEPAPQPKKTDEIDRSKIDTTKLVWPLPPDLPRIRFVKEFFGEPPKVVEVKKKKQGWMDRMAGVQQRDEVKASKDVQHILVRPYGIAEDSKGKIYVADNYVGAIFIFAPENPTAIDFIRNGVEGRFKAIVGLAMDDNDRLFVSDADLHHILVFDANKKLEAIFGDDVLGRPNGMALDPENRLLYVVDVDKETVVVFDADTFKVVRKIGGPAKKEGDEDPGTFAKPTNVALDADRNVYVTDTINNRIQVFDADGQFITMFGKAGDGPGAFARPKGIAVDCDKHIWVVDAAQDNAQIYDLDGHLLAFFGYGGKYPGQFGLPAGILIDKQNRVFISDQVKGRVQIFRYTTEAEHAAEVAERQKQSGAQTDAAATTPVNSGDAPAAKPMSSADRLNAAGAEAAAAAAKAKAAKDPHSQKP